jgi:hypothetical protein
MPPERLIHRVLVMFSPQFKPSLDGGEQQQECYQEADHGDSPLSGYASIQSVRNMAASSDLPATEEGIVLKATVILIVLIASTSSHAQPTSAWSQPGAYQAPQSSPEHVEEWRLSTAEEPVE